MCKSNYAQSWLFISSICVCVCVSIDNKCGWTWRLSWDWDTRQKCSALGNDVWIKQRKSNNFNVVCVVNTQSFVVLHSTKSKLRSSEVPSSNTIIIRGSNKIMYKFLTYMCPLLIFTQISCKFPISHSLKFISNS